MATKNRKPEAGKTQGGTYRKVAIVGTASTVHMAPYDDPSFEIWGVNNGYLLMKRWTRWFEIHNITYDGTRYYRRGQPVFRGANIGEYMAQLARLDVPVYMQRHWDIIPKSIEYPINDAVRIFGGKMGWYNHDQFEGAQPEPSAYFTNTITYMIVLALMEQFDEIHLYGVDMATDSEYGHQKPSCEYFIGLAVGLGKKVFVPPQCDLLKARFMYGFQETVQDNFEAKLKNMRENLGRQINDVAARIEHDNRKREQLIGADGAIGEILKAWR